MKKGKWIGLTCVLLATVSIVVYKQLVFSTATLEVNTSSPTVLLVANLNEAEDADDRCGDIIRAVRATEKRGVTVKELMPNSTSALIKRYRVVSAPTVIIIDKDGNEAARYEGEDDKTVKGIETHLAKLSED